MHRSMLITCVIQQQRCKTSEICRRRPGAILARRLIVLCHNIRITRNASVTEYGERERMAVYLALSRVVNGISSIYPKADEGNRLLYKKCTSTQGTWGASIKDVPYKRHFSPLSSSPFPSTTSPKKRTSNNF